MLTRRSWSNTGEPDWFPGNRKCRGRDLNSRRGFPRRGLSSLPLHARYTTAWTRKESNPSTVRSRTARSDRLSYVPSLRRSRKRREPDSNRQAIAGHPLSKRAGSPRSRVTAHLSRTTRSAGGIRCASALTPWTGFEPTGPLGRLFSKQQSETRLLNHGTRRYRLTPTARL